MTTLQTAAPARIPARDRLRGILLCLIGSALALAMLADAWQGAASYLRPGELIDDSRFAGTLEQGRWVLALMASVAITGGAFVAMGVHLVRTSQRGRRLTWLAAGALGVTLATAWQLLSMLG